MSTLQSIAAVASRKSSASSDKPLKDVPKPDGPFYSGVRGKIQGLVESNKITNAIIAVIILNAFVLGLQTIPAVNDRFAWALERLDTIALAIFVVELLLKLFVYRFRFFLSAWNIFDFLIVAISFVPGSGTSVLRALRVLRVLRLISAIPSLRIIVQALITAIPSMTSVIGLLFLVFYVFGVMATKLYGGTHPVEFGSLFASFLTLFQMMIMDSWSDLVRGLMDQGHASASWFFVTFVIISGFAVLNLFIGILVNAMETAKHLDDELHGDDEPNELQPTLETLTQQIAQLQASIDELKREQR